MINDNTIAIFDEILRVTIKSYDQETNRSSLLLTKSDYLIKYITATFVFINAISAFLIANKVISSCVIVIGNIAIGAILCFSLYFAVNVQLFVRGNYFPTGMEIFRAIKNKYNADKIEKTPLDLRMDTIKYYSDYIDNLEKSNNKKAEMLNSAYKVYLIGVVCITLFFFIILILAERS